jgi:hypothetical protein
LGPPSITDWPSRCAYSNSPAVRLEPLRNLFPAAPVRVLKVDDRDLERARMRRRPGSALRTHAVRTKGSEFLAQLRMAPFQFRRQIAVWVILLELRDPCRVERAATETATSRIMRVEAWQRVACTAVPHRRRQRLEPPRPGSRGHCLEGTPERRRCGSSRAFTPPSNRRRRVGAREVSTMTSPHSLLIPCRVCNTTATVLGMRRLPEVCGRCGAPYLPAIAAFGRPSPPSTSFGPDRRRSPRLVP